MFSRDRTFLLCRQLPRFRGPDIIHEYQCMYRRIFCSRPLGMVFCGMCSSTTAAGVVGARTQPPCDRRHVVFLFLAWLLSFLGIYTSIYARHGPLASAFINHCGHVRLFYWPVTLLCRTEYDLGT